MTWLFVVALILAVIVGAGAVLLLLGYIAVIAVSYWFDKAMGKFFPKGFDND